MRENFRASYLSALTKSALKKGMDLAAEPKIAMIKAIEPPVPNEPPGNLSSSTPVALEAEIDVIVLAGWIV